METIQLTTEQLKIINHVLFHVEKDYSGFVQSNMAINNTDIKHIVQTRNKILTILNKL